MGPKFENYFFMLLNNVVEFSHKQVETLLVKMDARLNTHFLSSVWIGSSLWDFLMLADLPILYTAIYEHFYCVNGKAKYI